MQGWLEESPPNIVSGQGCYLHDDQGRTYLDGVSSLWCNVHGHGRPEIDAAIRDQLDRIAHTTLLGLRSPPSEELADRLCHIAPEGLEWAFYSDSGSTAVEIALKMAFQHWRNRGEEQRDLFVTLGEAYHGDTIGSVSLGGIDLFHRIFGPLLFKSLSVPSPHCLRCPLGLERETCELACADLWDRAFSENPGRIAAAVVEPLVQGAAGIVVHPPGYLAKVRAACDAHGVLLVCDEVATGFGRTGTMFACEHEDVRPDLMAVAKGLTGGYLPLAATLATDAIYDSFLAEPHEGRQFFHGHTFTGNALACAAANASLKIMERDRVIESTGPKIELLARLLERFNDHENVIEIRRRGLMVGIELASSPAAGSEPFDPSLRMGHRVVLEARERGVILRPLGDVVVLMPPLAMSEAQLEQLVDVTARAIDGAIESARA